MLGRECHVSGPRTQTLRLTVARGGRREEARASLKIINQLCIFSPGKKTKKPEKTKDNTNWRLRANLGKSDSKRQARGQKG